MALALSRSKALLGSKGQEEEGWQFTAQGETHHRGKAAILVQEALAFC